MGKLQILLGSQGINKVHSGCIGIIYAAKPAAWALLKGLLAVHVVI